MAKPSKRRPTYFCVTKYINALIDLFTSEKDDDLAQTCYHNDARTTPHTMLIFGQIYLITGTPSSRTQTYYTDYNINIQPISLEVCYEPRNTWRVFMLGILMEPTCV